MRRLVIALGAIALAATGAGCGSQGVTRALPVTVIGTLPKAPTGPTSIPPGNAAAGKQLFVAQGCGSCHTFAPAKSTGTIGPNLGNLAASAKVANQGTLQQYTFLSIQNPNAYIVPNYPASVMPNFGSTLSKQQIADLTAYLTTAH